MINRFIGLVIGVVLLLPGCGTKQNGKTATDNNTTTLEYIEEPKSKGMLNKKLYQQDFGTVKLGKTLICEFTLINTGSELLKILEHNVSCNCSELRYNEAIPANDSIKLYMIINTEGKKCGKHNTGALLRTNGEQRRFYDIKANYTIEE